MKHGTRVIKIDTKKSKGYIFCNMKKYEPYLDIYYEEFQEFNMFQTDEEEYKTEFLIINPYLLDLVVKDGNSVSNTPVLPAVIKNFSLPNE